MCWGGLSLVSALCCDKTLCMDNMQDGNISSDSLIWENNNNISNFLHMLPVLPQTSDARLPLGSVFIVNEAIKSRFRQVCEHLGKLKWPKVSCLFSDFTLFSSPSIYLSNLQVIPFLTIALNTTRYLEHGGLIL